MTGSITKKAAEAGSSLCREPWCPQLQSGACMLASSFGGESESVLPKYNVAQYSYFSSFFSSPTFPSFPRYRGAWPENMLTYFLSKLFFKKNKTNAFFFFKKKHHWMENCHYLGCCDPDTSNADFLCMMHYDVLSVHQMAGVPLACSVSCPDTFGLVYQLGYWHRKEDTQKYHPLHN